MQCRPTHAVAEGSSSVPSIEVERRATQYESPGGTASVPAQRRSSAIEQYFHSLAMVSAAACCKAPSAMYCCRCPPALQTPILGGPRGSGPVASTPLPAPRQEAEPQLCFLEVLSQQANLPRPVIHYDRDLSNERIATDILISQ